MQATPSMQPSEELRRALRKDEKILWWGKPLPRVIALQSLAISIFGLFFIIMGLIFIWTTMGSGLFSSGQDICVVASPLVFVVLGAFMTFGVPVYTYLNAKVTEYAVTNKRLINKYGLIGRDYKFSEFDKIQSVDVVVGFWDKSYGVGTVRAVLPGVVYSDRSNIRSNAHIFWAIENAHEVQKLINSLMEETKYTSTGVSHGAPIPTTKPSSTSASEPPKRFCKHCGAAIDADSMFCASCGQKI